MKDKVAAKARLQTTRQTLLKNQIKARLKQIEIQIRQVDAAIAEKVALDKPLSNKLAILISIPGIAKTTAFSS
jgi:transposase